MTLRALILPLTIMILSACGGGTTTDDDPPDGDGGFTAKIDGAAWSSPALMTTATGGTTPGTFTIVGGSGTASLPSISMTLGCIRGTGTYPLGVSGLVGGGIATLSQASSAWSTPTSGAAGNINISAISATQIKGTFNFVATPAFGSLTGTKTVTDGSFDLPLRDPGSLIIPQHTCNLAGGTLNGAPWNAASVVMVSGPASGTLAMGFSNNEYMINFTISGIAGAGPYPLNTGVVRQVTVYTMTSPIKTWGGSGALSSGTFNITSVSSSRVAGNFNIALQPGLASPGTGTFTFSGTFDAAIPQ